MTHLPSPERRAPGVSGLREGLAWTVAKGRAAAIRTLLAEAANGDAWQLAAHDEIRVVLRHESARQTASSAQPLTFAI
jgi:hypothetical protein